MITLAQTDIAVAVRTPLDECFNVRLYSDTVWNLCCIGLDLTPAVGKNFTPSAPHVSSFGHFVGGGSADSSHPFLAHLLDKKIIYMYNCARLRGTTAVSYKYIISLLQIGVASSSERLRRYNAGLAESNGSLPPGDDL